MTVVLNVIISQKDPKLMYQIKSKYTFTSKHGTTHFFVILMDSVSLLSLYIFLVHKQSDLFFTLLSLGETSANYLRLKYFSVSRRSIFVIALLHTCICIILFNRSILSFRYYLLEKLLEKWADNMYLESTCWVISSFIFD